MYFRKISAYTILYFPGKMRIKYLNYRKFIIHNPVKIKSHVRYAKTFKSDIFHPKILNDSQFLVEVMRLFLAGFYLCLPCSNEANIY